MTGAGVTAAVEMKPLRKAKAVVSVAIRSDTQVKGAALVGGGMRAAQAKLAIVHFKLNCIAFVRD